MSDATELAAHASQAGGVTGKVLVIVNPASASGRTERRWKALDERLSQLGLDTVTYLTTAQGDAIGATRDHVQRGVREIVVLGGDGTLNEVVAGCVEPSGERMVADGVTIAVVHQGTGGDMARGLDIPKDLHAALAVAASGSTRTVDVGVTTYRDPNGTMVTRAFMSCANVGLGADVCLRATGRIKRLGNSGAFALASVWSFLTNHPRRVTVTIDGVPHALDITEMTIANNRYMGGGMLVAPMAEVDDGMLDAIIVGAAGKLRLIRTFPKIYKGTHIDDPLVRWQRARSIEVDSPPGEPPQGVALDGEVVGTTPVNCRLLPGALRIRVP